MRRWEVINTITGTIEAFMNETSDFPFAKHSWYFTDGSICSDIGKKSRNLNFHLKVEQPGNFCCDDGTCYRSDWRCDGEVDCLVDASDEKDCQLVVIPPTYNKQIPPRPQGRNDEISLKRLKIKVKTTIFNLFDIDDTQSFFQLSFGLELKWEDLYLTYNFLNSNPHRNVLEERVKKNIWMPLYSLSMLKDADLFETASNVFVERVGKPHISNEENETYSGNENYITIETVKQAKFICSFNNIIKNYPFGKQYCSFNLFLPGIDNHLTELVPQTFLNVGKKYVGQYKILEWKIHAGPVFTDDQQKFNFSYKKIENDIGLVYSVHLSRNIGNIILVTYLPTFLMNLINQATNYISSPDKYEIIYTINITCMMVLASIYLAVSTSLPPTAEIKPVEVWLLSSLVYPALIIVLNILIQVITHICR